MWIITVIDTGNMTLLTNWFFQIVFPSFIIWTFMFSTDSYISPCCMFVPFMGTEVKMGDYRGKGH